jgi:hypothetical protein
MSHTAGSPHAYPAQGPPQALSSYPGGNTLECEFCGCVPAAHVKFRGHRGMIVVMQFLDKEGFFCRNCGLATFRKMTADTLIQGWYGYASFVITPFIVLINLVRRQQVASLPTPQPSHHRPSRTPANPGKPLLARPTALIGLAMPFILVGLVVALVASRG